MKNKKVIIIVIIVLIVATFILKITLNKKEGDNNLIINSNKDTIYELFHNFPNSENIYFTSNSLYSKWSIGPTIYQIDIIAELTDSAYENFLEEIEFNDEKEFQIKINPHNIKYNWKNIRNTNIIVSRDAEDASITHIYLDEATKTIYVIALGGN